VLLQIEETVPYLWASNIKGLYM